MTVRGLDAGQRAALVINECQNGVVNPRYATLKGLAEQADERGIVGRISVLADAFRATGLPVMHCTIVPRRDWAGMKINCLLLGSIRKDGRTVEGSPQVEIHPGLTPREGDFVLERRRGLTAFHGTELDPLLRNLGVETVVLVGVSTNIAVPGISIEAVNYGYQVVVPEDCVAGGTAETHDFMVRNVLPLLATVTTSADVAAALKR